MSGHDNLPASFPHPKLHFPGRNRIESRSRFEVHFLGKGRCISRNRLNSAEEKYTHASQRKRASGFIPLALFICTLLVRPFSIIEKLRLMLRNRLIYLLHSCQCVLRSHTNGVFPFLSHVIPHLIRLVRTHFKGVFQK